MSSTSDDLKKAQVEYRVKKEEVDELKRKVRTSGGTEFLRPLYKKNKELKKAKKKLDLIMSEKKLKVSEHACLRFLERTSGITRKQIEEKILTEELLELYQNLGDGVYPTSGGVRAKVRNGVIVTIID